MLKYVGLGGREYFGDNWNRLDFLVVMESIVTFVMVRSENSFLFSTELTSFVVAIIQDLIPGLDGAIFSAKTLRLLRLLRPLRTLRFIPVSFSFIHSSVITLPPFIA